MMEHSMENIRDFFKETENNFTVYVVEQRFVLNRGADYFRSFKGKENYIDSNKKIQGRLSRILNGIAKRVPQIMNLTQKVVTHSSLGTMMTPVGVADTVSSLSKIFTMQQHQAAGPDVIDPIIIQEGSVLQKHVNQLIALHQLSILQPVIIVLLKDNNFERAIKELAACPHNTNIKMIRNTGDSIMYKVINHGASDINDFLEAFSSQCFSTCSNTKRDILLNEECSENSFIRRFAPSILHTRTNFLYKDKTLEREHLNTLLLQIEKEDTTETEQEAIFCQTFECILRLYRVFCNDGGQEDIKKAYAIAKHLNNDILLAHVYRYSSLQAELSYNEKIERMDWAHDVFERNAMEDNAVYCRNNSLVRSFDTDFVDVDAFRKLQAKAIYNVPGLVGMSHILNNTGVAHLVTGNADLSFDYFEKGLNYSRTSERSLQRVALLCNYEIANLYSANKINENNLHQIMNMIFDNPELQNIPFISARYAINTISLALQKHMSYGMELLHQYPVAQLAQRAFGDNTLGNGQLKMQIDFLTSKFDGLESFSNIQVPTKVNKVTGYREKFISDTGLNPFVFSTWF